MTEPRISVVLPLTAGDAPIESTLAALRRSDFPRDAWELIVVADVKHVEPSFRALGRADVVVRLPGTPRGSAYARNHGVDVARAPIALFLDPWAAVRPDTIRRVVEAFEGNPDVAAVIGSFDDAPARHNIASQYRGLAEHFIHQRCAGDVASFWSGCGAVRRSAFLKAGGFDEWHFHGLECEDVEFGQRLGRLGYRIVLDPDVRVTQLRRWTVASLVRTDFHDRGVPWGRLVSSVTSGFRSGPPSLDARHRVGTATAMVATVGALAATVAHRYALLASVLVVLLGVALVDREFYAFLVRRRGVAFALIVTPLHLLTYLVNGFAVAWGAFLRATVGPPGPDPATQAFAEVGVNTWPPIPRRVAVVPPTAPASLVAASDGAPKPLVLPRRRVI